MKRHVPEDHRKGITVKLVCGSVAGLLGQTFTYPLDVVRRQMQVIYIHLNWSHSQSMRLKSNGWKYTGAGPTAHDIREQFYARDCRISRHDCPNTRMEAVIFRAQHQLPEGESSSTYLFLVLIAPKITIFTINYKFNSTFKLCKFSTTFWI